MIYLNTLKPDAYAINAIYEHEVLARMAKRCEEHGPFELVGNRRHCPLCPKK